jgi:probable rRNA maturation factor
MEPGSSRIPAAAGIPDGLASILVADRAWRRLLRCPEALICRALRAAGENAQVVLASDAAVKRLNARHRGINKPTNVLTFEPGFPGGAGEIILAFGTVAREAAAARRRPAHHLAHLVVHGSLHLQGHNHGGAGAARRMEMAESRIMGRLKLPNPWKRT